MLDLIIKITIFVDDIILLLYLIKYKEQLAWAIIGKCIWLINFKPVHRFMLAHFSYLNTLAASI